MSLFRQIGSRFIAPATGVPATGMLRCAFDLESNGLLGGATAVHCLVIINLDSDQVDEYGPDRIAEGLEHLSRVDYLVGHNIVNFDLPLLRKLHDWTPKAGAKIVDTLVAGRLILPHLSSIDDEVAARTGQKLGKLLRGRYSIEAWGARLGIAKIGIDITDWSRWTPEMQARCAGDTAIAKALWQFLQPDGSSPWAMELEHRVAPICEAITAAGMPFDVRAAAQLYQQWAARHAEIGARLRQQFPGLNPNSNKQLGALLEAKGWVPEQRTEKTKRPKITDKVLEAIPTMFPEFEGLAEYLILGRRIAALRTGDEAWCKHVTEAGLVHGGLVHIGTPHSRATHLEPNLAQVPNPKRGKPFATECRSLFTARDGWVLVACDQATLQDRGFAHYLSAFDGGAYAKDFLAGVDAHWRTATALGLVKHDRDKESKVDTVIREGSKSFRYAFLYGVGAETAGAIVATTIRAACQHDPASDLPKRFFGGEAHPKGDELKRLGGQALKKFIAATPGLQELRAKLEAYVENRGWLPGLDARRVPVRAKYTALNYIVTSSEAIICKRWLVRTYDELRTRFRYGWDGDVVIVLWVHDEIVACCRPEIAQEVGEIMVRNAKEPGEFYKFKVPLDADYKIGRNWAGDPVANGTVSEPETVKGNGADRDRGAEIDPNPDECPPWEGSNELAQLVAKGVGSLSVAAEGGEAIVVPNAPAVDPTPQPEAPRTNGHTDADGFDLDQERRYPAGERRGGQHVATYLYRDYLGKPHTKVEKWSRSGQRTQYPQSFWVDGAWAAKKPANWQRIPYRLPEMLMALARAPNCEVFIPEGEKDCETLAALGLTATTNAEGATPLKAKISKWTPDLNRWFTGVRQLYILEDNDEVGRKFAGEKAASLSVIIPDVRIVSFPDVPVGEDVTFWLHDLKHTKDELLSRCREAERWQGGGTIESVCAEQVTMRTITWLWRHRFALGKIGIVAGLPDEGKGQVLCYIAARITGAISAWPNDEGAAPKGNVLFLSAEEDPHDSLVPRLKAAGADLSRVHLLSMVHDRDEKTGQAQRRMFSFVTDLEKLRAKIVEIGDVVAIMIDPISAYLGVGKVDSYRDTDVRAVLGPLKELGQEVRASIISVMHFNKKVDITNALLRVSNSMAFVGLPRHVFGVIADRDNARKLFVRAKNNDAAESANQTLAFSFNVNHVGDDPESGEPIYAPFIVWEDGYIDVTATEAMQAASENKSPGGRDKAKQFVLDLLINGSEIPTTEIKGAAEANGLSWRTINRAKDELKKDGYDIIVDKDRAARDGKWFWKLSQKGL